MEKKPFQFFWMKPKQKPNKKKRYVKLRTPEIQRGDAREFEWFLKPSGSCPESALGIAVLQRAILDIITPGVSDKDRCDAMNWINGVWGEKHEATYPLSFSRIVESFSKIGVDEFRRKVLTFAKTARQTEEMADVFRFQRG